ncbi:MAG: hypothetical protein ABI135_12165 [Rhodoferax sp.]
MLHPLLHLVATQPRLLLDHAEGYADLVAEEIANASAAWKRRALLSAIALFCLGVAVIFAGVALMLWAVAPALQNRALGILVAVPVLPLFIGLLCLLIAKVGDKGGAFDDLRRQVRADMNMLREVSPP